MLFVVTCHLVTSMNETHMYIALLCDFLCQIWDPFTGDTVRQLESTAFTPVIALAPLPRPSSMVVTATVDNTLRSVHNTIFFLQYIYLL